MRLTLITPTGDRPAAFALCEQWMQRQTVGWDQWLVYDDGVTPTTCTLNQHYLRCPQYAGRGSLISKLHHAFSSGLVQGDACAFIEDDDWYHPKYLEVTSNALSSGYDMAGEGQAVYYNVQWRVWSVHSNMHHASLCQTMVKASLYPIVMRRCQEPNPFLDVRLWKTECRKLVFPPQVPRLLIGIKGMPGRKGYGVGHTKLSGHADPNLSALRGLIGDDAELYKGFKL